MNYISFVLYGTDPKYQIGAIRNAEEAKYFYPDFVPTFCVSHEIPKKCIATLKSLGARISFMRGSQITNRKFWRALAVEKPNADVVLVRDTDSRFSERETRAVEQWLSSDRLFHVMRDYPAHDVPIMGGTWGCKKQLRLRLYNDMVNWLRVSGNRSTESDQRFLAEIVWPKVQHSVLQHSTFFRDKFMGSIPFPDGDITPNGSFVGEIFDEHNQPQSICRYARTIGKKAEDL